MSIEENRNCNCGSQMYNQSMSMSNLTNTTCNCNDNCECEAERTVDCDVRREMLQEIRCLEFAINELALYLDTHPDDQKALCLHRKYCKEVKDLKDKYQKVFGPLTINYPCNKWRWLEEPWPWERGNF